ncbi:DUF882 domain-containing protein [Shewanella sp. 3B26]|uniref:Murein endopeptidase K n=1 Tax=Shewanella zhuhaiensis TaxID=2919576 RepID=A0AAJ1BKT0_9GAMM|nr:DUF882 domain-containing protein [Shewanella zhuhaiensis]
MTDFSPARRQLMLGLGSAAMVSMISSPAFASRSTQGSRMLSMLNLHTREEGKGAYWIDGEYQRPILTGFDHLLRDHRANEAAPMDKRLYDLLFYLQENLKSRDTIHIISGYRSPKTNAMLAKKSGGVAKKSLHMEGKAIDIAIPGVRLDKVRDAAKELKLGGVGYYPQSGFVHVDVGRVRSW